jgi:hypothetical protein
VYESTSESIADLELTRMPRDRRRYDAALLSRRSVIELGQPPLEEAAVGVEMNENQRGSAVRHCDPHAERD